jgi:ketosteroid isomerase-like protein
MITVALYPAAWRDLVQRPDDRIRRARSLVGSVSRHRERGRPLSLSIEELAGRYHQGWADRSADVIAELHTDDSVFHMHGVTGPAVGRGPVRDLVASLLRLVPDLHFEAKRLYVGTDHIVFEYDMSGTADGSRFVCDGADVIAVTDGLVARKDTYLDLVALLDQIGTMPAMGADL